MIGRSATIVGLFHLISRIFGLMRSMLLANLLGTTFIADSFTIAFKLPNILRRFVGEGSMSAAFIPVFSDVQKECAGNKREESRFLSCFFTTVLILLFLLCALGIFFAPWMVKFLYAFGDQPSEYAVFLTRYMFGYLLFVSLAAAAQGTLNANQKFAIPASTSTLLNIVIIGSGLCLTPLVPDSLIERITPGLWPTIQESAVLLTAAKASLALATGVLAGGCLQFLVQVPLLLKLGYRFKPYMNFKDPHLKKIGHLMIPGIFALGIHQINALVADPFALAYLKEGAIAALHYSNRLLEFSLGVFVISLSTVILPSLSRYVSEGDLESYSDLVKRSARMVIFISLPSAAGLIVLREPLIRLLFGSGLFQSDSVSLVSNALRFHAVGLLPIGLYRIYAPAFYAQKDTRTPVLAAGLSLCFNLILCWQLPRFMGIGGIALAATLASAANALFLIHQLQKKQTTLHWHFMIPVFWKSFLASTVMFIALVLFLKVLCQPHLGKLLLAFQVGLAVFSGAAVFAIMAYLFKIEEVSTVKRLLFKKGLLSKHA